jgi:hypothetical protein
MDRGTLVKPLLRKRLSAGLKRRRGGRRVLRSKRKPDRKSMLRSSERQSGAPLSGMSARIRNAPTRQNLRKLAKGRM